MRHARALVAGLVAGLVAVAAAFAGVVLSPQPRSPEPRIEPLPDASDVAEASGTTAVSSEGVVDSLSPRDIGGVVRREVRAPSGGRTPAGTFLVGAARASLAPAPTLFGGERWMREGCTSIEDQSVSQDHALPQVDPADPEASLDDVRSWPATPRDCIYLGGFGIGPYRYAKAVGPGGVWVRALSVSNGEETFVYAIADVVGWFARYDSTICSDCGVLDVRERLATDLGVDVGSMVVGSTHTHAGADTYGGWGGIPSWYRNQIRDAAIAASKQAVANLRPATISVGETHLRDRNEERRDTYYSTVDTGATWLQARTLPARGSSAKVITTMLTYAAHPTIVGDAVLHADWPGAAARRLESVHGGVGVVFEGGLGNASVSAVHGDSDVAEAEATGRAIADEVSRDIAAGRRLASSEMAAATRDVVHPVSSNPGIVTLASVGFFDREFVPGTPGGGEPGSYHWSKSGETEPGYVRGCDSSGPSLRTVVGAHRIGELLVAFAPGEIFSNIAEVIKERADDNAVAMVLGQSNDALGYIIQSFEFDAAGNAITEYGTQTGEYEEVFAVDRCFGDHVLDAALSATEALGFGR